MKRTNLINERKNKDLTQKEVAKLIGISHQQYSRLEKGHRNGSVKVWDKLEDLFNVPQRQLREINKSSNLNNNEKIIPQTHN